MPDGRLYLLALPPEGPEATPPLRLLCSVITDHKSVISGILLVTPHQIFFEPCGTGPATRDRGGEDCLLSCSVDKLLSVCVLSDVSHLDFNPSHHRRKEKNIFQKFKSSRSPSCKKTPEDPHSDPVPVLDPDPVPDPAGVCGQEEAGRRTLTWTDRLHDGEAEKSSVEDPTSGPGSPDPAALVFVSLRVQSGSETRRRGRGLHLGPEKPSSERDVLLGLSQQSAGQLQAYLSRCRPDLSTLPGDREAVLPGDREADQMSQEQRSSGDGWEMVSMEDGGDRTPVVLDQDPEELHQVVEGSHILEASHVRELWKELPARTVGRSWQPAYSTRRHGASLRSLYRKLQATDSPAIVVIRDALDEVFGAFLSHPLRPSEEFYGTGETFLFMLHPRFKCFKWTGENSFFIKGYSDAFAIGGGSGHFGLWLDENLYLGHSSPCYTFNNCCLSESRDFRVMELEVWTFR